MESLAYVHQAIAYTESAPAPQIVLGQNLNLGKLPSSAWLKFVGVSVIIAASIIISESAQAAPSQSKVFTDSGMGLNIRDCPDSYKCNIVGGLSEGAIVTVDDSGVDGWAKITNGPSTGYFVSYNYLVGVNSGPSINPSIGKYLVDTRQGIGLNVRALPTTGSKVVGGLGEGASVNAVDSGGGWAKIVDGPYAGYFVSAYSLVGFPSSSGGKYLVDTRQGIGLNVRALPTTGSKVVGGLSEGASVNAVDSGGGWAKIVDGPYAGYFVSAYSLVGFSINGDSNSDSSGNGRVSTNNGIGLNVRALPTTSSKIVGGLGENASVNVVNSGTPGWGKVVSGPYSGYFVSTDWVK